MVLQKIHYDKPKPRILQHVKKRYSLRLEEVFWNQIKMIAERERKRPGAIIAHLDQSYNGPNLSSYIRSYCMSDMQRQSLQSSSETSGMDPMNIVKSSPASAVIINHHGIITDANPALMKWLGDSALPVLNNYFTEIFKPRMSRSFQDTLDFMSSGKLKRTQMQVSYTRPHNKQNVSALATLITLTSGPNTGFHGLVWFSVSPPYRLKVR